VAVSVVGGVGVVVVLDVVVGVELVVVVPAYNVHAVVCHLF